VEHAAAIGEMVAFKDLFLRREEEEGTDDVDLINALEVMRDRWPTAFTAKNVADFMNDTVSNPNLSQADINKIWDDKRVLFDLFFGEESGKKRKDGVTDRVTPKALTRFLGAHVGNVVRTGDEYLALRVKSHGAGHVRTFTVEAKPVGETTTTAEGHDGGSREDEPPSSNDGKD